MLLNKIHKFKVNYNKDTGKDTKPFLSKLMPNFLHNKNLHFRLRFRFKNIIITNFSTEISTKVRKKKL